MPDGARPRGSSGCRSGPGRPGRRGSRAAHPPWRHGGMAGEPEQARLGTVVGGRVGGGKARSSATEPTTRPDSHGVSPGDRWPAARGAGGWPGVLKVRHRDGRHVERGIRARKAVDRVRQVMDTGRPLVYSEQLVRLKWDPTGERVMAVSSFGTEDRSGRIPGGGRDDRGHHRTPSGPAPGRALPARPGVPVESGSDTPRARCPAEGRPPCRPARHAPRRG